MKLPFSGKSRLEAQVADLQAQLKAEKVSSLKLQNEIESLKNKPSEPNAEIETLKTECLSLKAELETARKAVADFELSVATKAQDQLAAIGIEKVAVVPEDKTTEEIVAKYKSITNLAEQRKFYERNYSVLKGI